MVENNDGSIIGRKFHLTIISAKNLPNVRKYMKTRAYAQVTIGSATRNNTGQTPTDEENGLNPAWNHVMECEVAESSGVLNHGLSFVIKVYTERSFGPDRYIGEIHTTMKDLYDIACSKGGSATLSLPLTRGSVETDGILNISYSFGERCKIKKPNFMDKFKQFGANFMTEMATQNISLAFV